MSFILLYIIIIIIIIFLWFSVPPPTLTPRQTAETLKVPVVKFFL